MGDLHDPLIEDEKDYIDTLLKHCINNINTANEDLDLLFVEELGTGAHARVWRGFLYDEEVALKLLNKRLVRGTTDFQDALQEVKIQMGLHHPNIVQYKGCLISETGAFWIVMEYASKKTLFDRINHRNAISANYALSCATQIANALVHLHDGKEIVHDDIRAPNIFIDSKGNAKLGDFGLATFAGSVMPRYNPPEPEYRRFSVAPELRIYNDGEGNEEPTPTFKSDIYSFGHLLGVMAEAMKCEKRCAIRKKFLDLRDRCMKENPKNRPKTKKVHEELKALRDLVKKNRNQSTGCILNCWMDFLVCMSCGTLFRPPQDSSNGSYSRLPDSEHSGFPWGSSSVGLGQPQTSTPIAAGLPETMVTMVRPQSSRSSGADLIVNVVQMKQPTPEERQLVQSYIDKQLAQDPSRPSEFTTILDADLNDPVSWREMVKYFFGPRTAAFRLSTHWRAMKKLLTRKMIPSITLKEECSSDSD